LLQPRFEILYYFQKRWAPSLLLCRDPWS